MSETPQNPPSQTNGTDEKPAEEKSAEANSTQDPSPAQNGSAGGTVTEGNMYAAIHKVLDKGLELKKNGNDFYKEGNLQEAYSTYSDAAKCVTTAALAFRDANDEKKFLECLEHLSGINTNIAICFMKTNQLLHGIRFASEAIKLNNKSAKPYYLRAKMYRLMGSLAQALDDINTSLLLAPESAETKQEKIEIEKHLAEESEESMHTDSTGMINPQVLRMLRTMNMGFNPMMNRKTDEERYQEELEKVLKISYEEEQARLRKEAEAKKKEEEAKQAQDAMKQYFEDQQKKLQEAKEIEQNTPAAPLDDEPFEVEIEEDEGAEDEAEDEGEEGEVEDEDVEIDEEDLAELEEGEEAEEEEKN